MAKVNKDRLAKIANASSKTKQQDVFAVPEATVRSPEPSGYVAAQRGARTGWNPEAAKPAPVRTYAPGAGLDYDGKAVATTPGAQKTALIDKVKASRRSTSPKPKMPSETVGIKPVPAERVTYSSRRESPSSAAQRSFLGSPAPSSGFRPSREGASFKPGSAADFAYTGVKPTTSPAKRGDPVPKRAPAPVPTAAAPTTKPLPKKSLGGRALGLGLMLNAGQAAYYEYQKRKNKKK